MCPLEACTCTVASVCGAERPQSGIGCPGVLPVFAGRGCAVRRLPGTQVGCPGRRWSSVWSLTPSLAYACEFGDSGLCSAPEERSTPREEAFTVH